ncbi:MAG: hypothetical protein KatS3mg104_1380 [Phycisphaerae bacterium]|jgi:hypothetical protein|nr:MAG: hypothetical protein KatS3mg104_1380 [Phycisphaerae bacterium]
MVRDASTYPVKNQLFRYLKVLLIGLWATAVLLGMIGLQLYASTPGQSGPVPSLQQFSYLPIDSQRSNLIIFIHPQCPCTRASLTELEKLIIRSENRLAVLSIVYTPSKPPKGWNDNSIHQQLQSIPGIRVIEDVDGELSRRFGAYTSGWTILYDRTGQPLYWGGITPQRGHEGDNSGSQAILRYLDDPHLPATQGPIFGCPILEKNKQVERKAR